MKHFKEQFAAISASIPNSRVYKLINEIKASIKERPLVLYGAGHLGGSILDICRDLNLKVDCFCDRMVPTPIDGLEVISPDVLRSRYSNAVIIVCSWIHNKEICEDLHQWGFLREQIVPCPCYYPCFTSLNRFSRHILGYEWAYDFFKDDRSKQLVYDKIRLALLDIPLVQDTDCDVYYEDSYITLYDNEVFVDGGAYIGDSTEPFLKKMENRNCRVHAFEPDKRSFAEAFSKLSAYPNVTLVEKGLWSSDADLIFSPMLGIIAISSASAVSENPVKFSIPVTSIDSYFINTAKTDLPTCIKMDIEGAEKEALIGSTEILLRCKPKLAICAYHKLEDIYELPQVIQNIRNDYQLAIRQHEHKYWDTVLYAV